MRMTWSGADGVSVDVSAREVKSLKEAAEVSVDITKRLHGLCRLLKGYAKTGRRIDPDQLYALLDVMDEQFDQLVDQHGMVDGYIADAEPLSLLPLDTDPSSDRRTLRLVSQPA
jgi:hypothetical protein